MRRLERFDHRTIPYEDTINSEIDEYTKLDLMLKLTDSLQIGMIPGDGVAVDQKQFNWQVRYFSDRYMYIDVFFDNPD